MSSMTLYGWDMAAWQRAFDWAHEKMPFIGDKAAWISFLEVRQRWLNAGGPLDGPSGLIQLEGVRD